MSGDKQKKDAGVPAPGGVAADSGSPAASMAIPKNRTLP